MAAPKQTTAHDASDGLLGTCYDSCLQCAKIETHIASTARQQCHAAATTAILLFRILICSHSAHMLLICIDILLPHHFQGSGVFLGPDVSE